MHSRLLKEAMAPHIVGGLACGMAHGGHIRHENYEFIGIEGPAPVSASSCGPDLYTRDLDPVDYGGHTLGTAHGGCILEFTYVGGQGPLLSLAMARPFTPKTGRPWLMAI